MLMDNERPQKRKELVQASSVPKGLGLSSEVGEVSEAVIAVGRTKTSELCMGAGNVSTCSSLLEQ